MPKDGPKGGKDDVLEQKFVKEHLIKMQDAAAYAANAAVTAAATVRMLTENLDANNEEVFCEAALEATAQWLQDVEEQLRNAEIWCVRKLSSFNSAC